MLLPSIACFGKLDPVISAIVGRRSIVIVGSEQFCFSILSGHLMMQGTLLHPPKRCLALSNGFADPAWFP